MKKVNKKLTTFSKKPQRRLSPRRVMIAIVLLAGISYYLIWARQRWQEEQAVATAKAWFAAYVDVTSTPTYAFEQLGSTSTSNVILSFIVSSKSDACTPAWGTAYTLDEASTALDLDRRIARLQQQGGKVAISFGGAINDELSINCKDFDRLLNAYRSVVERYRIDTLDLDLENTSLSNSKAAKRRSQVIAELQKKRRAENRSLAVWLTMPVTPQGLTKEGTDAIAQMLISGVDLAGVNVMTMNYGNGRKQGQTMQKASEKALIETHRQLGILYKQAGINLSNSTLWKKIGATPMIGQNDIASEIFSLDDAQELNKFSRSRAIGRMSMWSANRDLPCGANYVNLQIVSDSCSGVLDKAFSFAQTLSAGFDGDLTQNSKIITTENLKTAAQKIDDPETSPYQIWKKSGAYLKGTKVVWHGQVYKAKWWTKADVPDNPILQSWETPWQLIGPVLVGEKPVPRPTLPTGTYPAWSGVVIYQAGERVLFDHIPFQAKWWNRGESPAASAADADNSPWTPLTLQEIKEILEKDSKIDI